MQLWHGKMGQNSSFLGKNPQFWGVFVIFYFWSCFYMSNAVIWYAYCVNRKMLIFAHFLIFSLYQRPPDFVVFGVLWTPYRKWWAPIQMLSYLTRFLIIWAFVDKNWMISLGCKVVPVQPLPRITFCQKGPKKGGFGEPRPHLRSRDHVTPKRHFLTREHVVWAINHQNRFSGSGCSPVNETRKKN